MEFDNTSFDNDMIDDKDDFVGIGCEIRQMNCTHS